MDKRFTRSSYSELPNTYTPFRATARSQTNLPNTSFVAFFTTTWLSVFFLRISTVNVVLSDMAKRPGGESSAPPAKRAAVPMVPLDIGPASGEEDLNLKVLQVRQCVLISASLMPVRLQLRTLTVHCTHTHTALTPRMMRNGELIENP